MRATLQGSWERLRKAVLNQPRIASLRAKLILPYVLLTVIIAALGMFVVTRLVSESFQERFSNQLLEASRVAADAIVRQEQAHLETLRLLANMQGIPEGLQQGEGEALVQTLAGIAANNRIEAISAVDLSGREIVTVALDLQSGDIEPYSGADFSSVDSIERVLEGQVDARGDKFAGLLESSQGTYLITTAPVRAGDGKLVGALWVGTRLSTLVADMKLQALADILLLAPDGTMMATTLVEPEEGYEVLALAGRIGPTDSLQALTLERELYGRPFTIHYSPLYVRGAPVGYMGAVLPSEYIVSTLATSRASFSLIFSLGTLAVILLGYLLAQHIARPILRLRSISQAVAGGDLEQSSGMNRRDEIGELASSFDIMTLRLRERTEEAARLYAEAVQRNKELAEINARLQAAQAQLIQSEKLAAVGQLTAGIVHDVKNPLAVIKGLAEELAEESNLDGFALEGLQTIRESASRANTIVTDLLKFARQSTPEKHRRDMRETIQSVLRLTEYLTRKAKVAVESELPDEPLMAVYDSQQIEQVLINLITNAVQAMPQGGRLWLELRRSDGEIAIAVQDEGIGIPEENMQKIFDPFFTTKPEGEGTGLGLSVSYGIVTQHGGRIEVESQVGAGTTFTVYLPAEFHVAAEETIEAEGDVAHTRG